MLSHFPFPAGSKISHYSIPSSIYNHKLSKSIKFPPPPTRHHHQYHPLLPPPMAVTDLFAGEIATELLKQLISIVRKSSLCRPAAEQLINHINELFPIIQEIKYSGVELPQFRQSQLDRLSELLRDGLDLSKKVLGSGRWNVYKNLQLARKMEKVERRVAAFLKGPLQAHLLADVHHLRFDTSERFDRLEGSARRIEQRLGAMKIGVEVGGWLEEEIRRMEEIGEKKCEGSLGNVGEALEVGVRKVKGVLMGMEEGVVGICGIGGIGKTTLAKEVCKDDHVKSYFGNKILFLTVSQSPNLEALKLRIWAFLSGAEYMGAPAVVPQWSLQCEQKLGVRKLLVLDDVWSLSVLEQLVFRVPGCKTLVVSRFRFPTVLNLTYEVELLKEDEALGLFCLSAFGQKMIPFSANENLVKQIVSECKGLPLALKVVGASLRDQPAMFWMSAKNRLSRGEPICESHEINLLERMKASIGYLAEKVRECFLDMAAFPEDKKIPVDVLINVWVEVHDLDEEEAFAILIELSEKNLLTLAKDSRGGDMYSSYYEIYVTQHDVLRDLALHLNNQGNMNQRRRLLMPKREEKLPRECERNADQPFHAQIVSLHTGKMEERDWLSMHFPKAEVLILNFASDEYFLPPFITNMPKLRSLILINNGASHAILHNLSVFAHMRNLRSLWLESICVPQLPKSTISLDQMRKLSLVLCKMDKNSDPSVVDLPWTFPDLTELTIDHCIDLTQLPESICWLRSLKSLSVTNCHSLLDLPADLGMLDSLQILRLYACPKLKSLPSGISQLVWLKYLNISQCFKLSGLPEGIGRLMSLEKIDMRECSHISSLPKSVASLQSLSHVVCDEEISWMWKDVEMALPKLRIQVAEECFTLDWLSD